MKRMLTVVAYMISGALAWQAASAGQQPAAGGYILERDAEIAKEEPGTHGGGGRTVGYSYFRNAAGLKLVFRKRALKPGSAIGYHLQKEDEIYYVLSGRGMMTIDGKSFEVGPGTAVLTRPGSSHGLKQIGSEDLVIMINYEQQPQTPRVQVTPNDAERRVDISIDGKPFTSYIYPTTLKKPVLYPLRAATGAQVTRGFPLDSREGERIDHPHQIGLWFNYGDVNGLDFWNNSDAIKPEQAPKMGSIVHRGVTDTKDGIDRGELAVEMDWIDSSGRKLLREQTRFVFRGTRESRSIDRITTLTALDQRVVFKDNKEGLLGLRVARALEQPADKPEVFADASGRATSVPVLDNTGVSGKYLSSEGLSGDAVWGTRGRWALLTGTIQSSPVTLAILDHPDNPGFPTYWHARGYGLFAANPLGQKVFSEGKRELNLTLEPGRSATFRYRVLIVTGDATTDLIEREYRAFSGAPFSN